MKANAAIRKGATTSDGGKLRISEIYASIQGEGLLTGVPSTFVRTSGCNLRCWFCDTKFASWQPEGEQLTVEEIGSRVDALPPDHIVLTGGEPMMFPAVGPLTKRLSRSHDGATRHITIETAGTMLHEVAADLMSISPKLAGSGPTDAQVADGEIAASWQTRHDSVRERLDVVRQLIEQYDYQLKFVVDSPTDAQAVLDYLDRLEGWSPDRVLLMPQGVTEDQLDQQARWLMPWCQQHNFRFCPRSHIHWFGNRRGT